MKEVSAGQAGSRVREVQVMDKARASALTLTAIGGFVVMACILGVRPYRSMHGKFKCGEREKGFGMTVKTRVKTAPPPKAAYTQESVGYFEDEVQHHKSGRARAVQLCRKGQANVATTTRLLEYQHCVRGAAHLATIVGVDGGTGIRLLDDLHIGGWVRARNTTLAAALSGIKADSPLSLGKAMLYAVTRGPRKGACYDLFVYHKTQLQHCRKMLKYAKRLQRKGLDRQARELLYKERDRCAMYSFLPDEHGRLI